jgi:hypothetical protein
LPTGDQRGYIQYHIGSSLDAMQVALANEQVGVFANLVRFFLAKAAPVLDSAKVEEVKKLFPLTGEFDRLPKGDRMGAYVERLNLVVETLLFELREKGYYAFGREEEAGDAGLAAIVDDELPEA